MRRLGSRVAVGLAMVVALSAAAAAQRSIGDELPEKPARYVTDRAGVLGAERADAINRKLEQFERDTSAQILVWIDRRIPERFTLEDFTNRAAEKWGIGQRETDNGAALFVFVDDRKLRIEVGYGLEGAIPDATAKRIIDDEIVPRFRANDYPGGIDAGVDALMAAAKGEYRGSGSTVAERESGSPRLSVPCVLAAFFLVFFVILPMMFRKKRRWRTFGGSGWWTGSGGGWGGWSGGGGGGGWSGGGGGFSGGGGSFGGGGASGSW